MDTGCKLFTRPHCLSKLVINTGRVNGTEPDPGSGVDRLEKPQEPFEGASGLRICVARNVDARKDNFLNTSFLEPDHSLYNVGSRSGSHSPSCIRHYAV